MEIKAELLYPFSEEQRMNFIIKQNHNNGYEIRRAKRIIEYKTPDGVLNEQEVEDLQAWGITEEEVKQQERKMLDNLTLTGADVERAIYEAKGMDFEDLIEFVKGLNIPGMDIKRLKIELKANNFYRCHDYINIVGQLLGYTPGDMDILFKTKHLPVKEIGGNE